MLYVINNPKFFSIKNVAGKYSLKLLTETTATRIWAFSRHEFREIRSYHKVDKAFKRGVGIAN